MVKLLLWRIQSPIHKMAETAVLGSSGCKFMQYMGLASSKSGLRCIPSVNSLCDLGNKTCMCVRVLFELLADTTLSVFWGWHDLTCVFCSIADCASRCIGRLTQRCSTALHYKPLAQVLHAHSSCIACEVRTLWKTSIGERPCCCSVRMHLCLQKHL